MPKATASDGIVSEGANSNETISSNDNEGDSSAVVDEVKTSCLIVRTGEAMISLLNKKFRDAVDMALHTNPQVNLTWMVSDYLAYSGRIRRSYLADHGEVLTCGNGDKGQLGYRTNDREVKALRLLQGLSHRKVVTIVCGGSSTTALTESGQVFSWGCAADGALGRPCSPETPGLFPAQVKVGLEGAIIIGLASGAHHTLALDISGKVYGWGTFKDQVTEVASLERVEGQRWFQPPEGEVMDAARRVCESPMVISGLPSDVVEVKCGASFCLALTSKGDVFSWGVGEFGELGRGAWRTKVLPPYDFGGLRDHLTPKVLSQGIKGIGCGAHHTIVVKRRDSEVWTCGGNTHGQLGRGGSCRPRLMLVEELNGLNTMAVAGGASHSMVFTTEGLFTFGSNDSGQLGCGAGGGGFETRPIAVHLPDDAGDPSEIKCGSNHCLVLTDKGELYTWGSGKSGALGHASVEDCSLPRKLDTGSLGIVKVLDADGGDQHTAIVGEMAPSTASPSP